MVPRPHLLQKLEAGLSSKLMLIAAPAGFGKSTLLSEWIGQPETSPSESAQKLIFCWLTLDESDNDPIRFWLYFIAALHSQIPDLSTESPALLQSPEPPPLETILTILLNDLNAWSPNAKQVIVLVLEDYHFIASPEIHQSLAFLLEHMPSTLHLVITTRSDPPLPLMRLRARGQLSEIRANDLRFTDAETALFLNERMGLELSSTEVQLLAERTEGWVVGLRLAALSMQGLKDKTDFLSSFSGDNRYILNYLIEEVLNQQPKEVQDFLQRTSILARLCGPLCDALLEESDAKLAPLIQHVNSQALLEQIDQSNLFLISLDDQSQWYRYHQLFAEVLQHRLRQNQPESVAALHYRASLWYDQNGFSTDAIQHALLSTNFVYAAKLIEEAWSALWNQGTIATLFDWMKALAAESFPNDPSDNITSPEDAYWGRPSLYVSYAWGLALTGQIEEAEASINEIETTLKQPWDQSETNRASLTHNTLLGRAEALRAMLAARRGESKRAAVLAEQALVLISNDSPERGDAYYALGLARQQQGLLAEAFQSYEAAAKLSIATNNSFLSVAARYHKARILMEQGHLQKATTAYQQILAMAANSKQQLPVVGLAHIGYGEILYQQDDMVAAAQHVNTGLALSPRRVLSYTDGPLHRFSILARIRQAAGDRDGALSAIELAKETAQQTGIRLDVEQAEAIEALIHLRLGKMTVAERWAEDYERRRTPKEQSTYLHEFETQVYVRILLAGNHTDKALGILGNWLPYVEGAQRHSSLIKLYALQGLAYYIDEQSDMAMHALVRSLVLAEPEGYVRLYIDEGEKMKVLLNDFRQWMNKQPSSDTNTSLRVYASRLLSAFSTPESSDDSSSAAAINNQNLIESLTDRELEVLQLLADGLSNAAISEQLVVSVGTIKTHLKHIYSKLDVKSRTQAVAKARALHLL